MEEKELLIKNNEWVIRKAAKSFYNSSYEDLYQVGVIGLINAYRNYQINTTAKFSTYAYDYIWGEMYKYVENLKLIKVNKDTLRLYREIVKVREALFQYSGKEPSSKEIALFLEIDEKLVVDAIYSGMNILSLDANFEDSELSYYDTIKNNDEVNIDERIIIKDAVNNLPSPEKEIIINRYFKDMTQSETALDLGITQVMVSRLEKKTLNRMRSNIAL